LPLPVKIDEVKEQGIRRTYDATGRMTSSKYIKGVSILGQPATDLWGEYTLMQK